MQWSNGSPPNEIKIGDPFPKSDITPPNSPGARVVLAGETAMFVIVLSELDPMDLVAFNESSVTFGVLCERAVVFLGLDFCDWIVGEASMDPYVSTSAEKASFINAGGRNFPVVLIDDPTQIVRGVRILPLRAGIANKTRALYNCSCKTHSSQISFRRTVEWVRKVSHATPKALVQSATMTQVFH